MQWLGHRLGFIFHNFTEMSRSEGDKHWENAEKALKKSLMQLRFSPDYVLAAVELRQAANSYQSVSDYDRAVAALVRLAGIREQQLDYYEAGRCHEDAARLVSRELRKDTESHKHMRTAVTFFEKCGKISAAVRVLTRLAEEQEERGDVQGSLSSLETTVKLLRLESTENWYSINDSYTKLTRCSAAHKLLEQCLKYMAEQNEILRQINQQSKIFKNRLASVAIHLYTTDIAAAEEVLSEGLRCDAQFCGSREFAVGCDAIDAYKEADVEKFTQTMALQTWTFLPTDLANLARSIPPPAGGKRVPFVDEGESVPPEDGDAANFMM